MPEHNSLTDPELHEPKGVSTASDRQVYIADGAGSGSWALFEKTGWANYEDNTSVAASITTTASQLEVDKQGTDTEEDFLPRQIRGAGTLWNSTTNRITPIAVGDLYLVKITLTDIVETGTPNTIKVEYDSGAGALPATAPRVAYSSSLPDANWPSEVTVQFMVTADQSAVSNGIRLTLSTNAGSAAYTGREILITRLHGE